MYFSHSMILTLSSSLRNNTLRKRPFFFDCDLLC